MSNLATQVLTHKEQVSIVTGEVKSSSSEEVKVFKRKRKLEHYFSVYLGSTKALHSLTKQQRIAFDLLCNQLGYETNRVDLNCTIRQELSSSMGITVGSFNNHLCALKKSGLLKTIGKNSFMLNPNLVFKGSLAKVVNLQQDYAKLP